MAAAFDRAELMERVDEDGELLGQLVQLLRRSLPEHLTELDQALATRDGARLGGVAHSLKGALLNLAAAPAAELARQLEEVGRRGDFDAAAATLVRFRNELGRLERALMGEVNLTDGV